MTWTTNNPGAKAAQYTAFIRHDYRDRATLISGKGMGNELASGLYWFDDVAMPAILVGVLLWLRRRNRMIVAADDKSAPILLDSAPIWFVVPTFLLSLLGLVIAVYQAKASNNPDYAHWAGLQQTEAVVTVLVAAVSARIWRVAKLLCASIAVLGCVALAVPTTTDISSWLPGPSICWAIYLYALATLIVIGVFESIKQLTSVEGYRASIVTPILAVCVAAAIIVERVVLDTQYYARQEWLDPAPAGAGWLIADLQNGTYTTLSTLNWLVLVVPVFSVWRLCRGLDETKAQSPAVRVSGGALLAYGVLPWALQWSAWTVPLGTLAVVAVFVYLRQRGYLSVLVDQKRTIADLVDGKLLPHLQGDVRRWQVRQQRLKALERALATGRDEMSGVRTWEQGAARQHVLARGPVGNLGRRVASGPLPANGGSSGEDVNPVDILLAVGPSMSPAENSRFAFRASRWPSIAAAAFITWLWSRNDPLRLPNLDDSAITTIASDYVWSLLQYSFGAAALGLLWHYLPGKRGAVKAIPIILAYAAIPALRIAASALFGGHIGMTPIADVALFTAIMMGIGVRMDAATLRGPGSISTSPRRIVLEAYRLQNVPTLLTFLAAQIGVIIAIWNVFHGTGDGGGGHDPSLVNHSGGGGNGR